MADTDTSYHRIPTERPEPPTGCPVDHAFSPLSDAYLRDPYSELAARRDESPIFYSDELGYLVVTRMEDITEVFLDHEAFGSNNVQDPVWPICEEAQAVLAAPDFNPVAVMSNRQRCA